MKKFINFLKGFSLIEIMITIIAIGVVTAASAPVITKRVQSHKTLINTTKIEVTPNCYDKYNFGYNPHPNPNPPKPFDLICQICYPEESLVCKGKCPSDHAKDDKKCKCLSCSGAEPNGLGMANCIECTLSPKKCKKCTPGYYLNGNTCKKCPEGHYCIDGIQKKECESGSYGAGEAVRTECTLCDKGTAQDKKGQSSCYSCHSGKYASTQGLKECEICPEAKYSPSGSARTSCDNCPKGKYNPHKNMSFCYNCTKGKAQNKTGQTSCYSCHSGKYASTPGLTECEICPEGRYSTQEEARTTCLTCPTGECNKTKGASSCKACSLYTSQCSTCAADTCECSGCKTGYSITTSKTCCSTACLKCKPETTNTCSECQTDKKLSSTGGICCDPIKDCLEYNSNCVCTKCKDGYIISNNLCVICDRGTYQTGNECKACPEGQYQDEQGKKSCKTCDDGYCSKTTGATSCNACNKTDSKCTQCNKKSCACTNCSSGYILNSNNICVDACPEECKTCTAGTTSCANCKKNHTLSISGGKCCPNKTGCKTYNADCTCATCIKNYFMKTKGSCTACPSDTSQVDNNSLNYCWGPPRNQNDCKQFGQYYYHDKFCTSIYNAGNDNGPTIPSSVTVKGAKKACNKTSCCWNGTTATGDKKTRVACTYGAASAICASLRHANAKEFTLPPRAALLKFTNSTTYSNLKLCQRTDRNGGKRDSCNPTANAPCKSNKCNIDKCSEVVCTPYVYWGKDAYSTHLESDSCEGNKCTAGSYYSNQTWRPFSVRCTVSTIKRVD